MNATESNHSIEIRKITLHAVVDGEWLIPIDCEGNRLSTKIRAALVNDQLGSRALDNLIWMEASRRIAYRAVSNASAQQYDPWKNRLDSLASSLRMRRRLPQTMQHSRQRFERYSTSTWEESIHRLWKQADNRMRKASRTGWERWADTVSRNHNRKGN